MARGSIEGNAILGYTSTSCKLYTTNHLVHAVRVNGELTEWFRTTVGVRQGCVMSPELFNILLEVIMLHATYDTTSGIHIQGHLINNLRFADSESNLQALVDAVYRSSCSFGLKINIAKTEVQVISKLPQIIKININGESFKQ